MSDVTYDPKEVQFVTGQRGSKLLSIGGFNFVKNRSTEDKTYWICSRKVKWVSKLGFAVTDAFVFYNFQYSAKCNARVITEFTKEPETALHLSVLSVSGTHTHSLDPKATSMKAEKSCES